MLHYPSLDVSLLYPLTFLTQQTRATTFATKCLSFTPSFPETNTVTITNHEFISANTNLTLPHNDKSCNRASQIVSVDICRLALSVQTGQKGNVVAEIWFPDLPEDGGTMRILAGGNGGIDGCIQYETLAYGTSENFISVAANNGHNGTSGISFLNNPDAIIDYAHRSLHTSVNLTKHLTSQFYPPSLSTTASTKSYFLGCSLGGRQGIDAADRYPSDFDGIVAGSPATDFNNLYAWRASFYTTTGNASSADFIDAEKWKVIHAEVLRQCDGIDGVEDGILEDPSLCSFEPEKLLCSEGERRTNTATCLTRNQIAIVRKIYSPFYSSTGNLIYPAMQPGNELRANTGLYSGNPWQPSVDWYRYGLLNDSTWDPATFDLSAAVLANKINPSGIRTFPTSLARFKEKGGKLIMYHGGQDHQITSFQGVRFYEHLAQGMNADSGALDEFYRFFRISGMFHCNSGPGAWAFGQGGGAPSAGVEFEREGNVLRAIVDWVENGVAPDTITGTKFVDDVVAKGVQFKRRHCRYPMRNVYVGGNATEVESWECRVV
ncbi:tannase and feruloyl esterase [Periconia macrospinosa]|uniref:Carboxylic ester hydrolase n=1 Tax=Periconia macrospinosa TaxID=97972 RepID=A0A2V1DS70_9PLEO|nr:tannase and feruloyl esterase [Periconia macrospinosa]